MAGIGRPTRTVKKSVEETERYGHREGDTESKSNDAEKGSHCTPQQDRAASEAVARDTPQIAGQKLSKVESATQYSSVVTAYERERPGNGMARLTRSGKGQETEIRPTCELASVRSCIA